jgi:hypothetical protein
MVRGLVRGKRGEVGQNKSKRKDLRLGVWVDSLPITFSVKPDPCMTVLGEKWPTGIR